MNGNYSSLAFLLIMACALTASLDATSHRPQAKTRQRQARSLGKALQVRLSGGYYGRVEVLYNNTWGTICDEGHSGWNINSANVACRQLGYSYATDALLSGAYGQGKGPVLFEKIMCYGDERNIGFCPILWERQREWSCRSAGVICKRRIKPVRLRVRLAGGKSRREGRVEVYYSRRWGTICDYQWGILDANVVCRQLGYPGALAAKREAFFGQGKGNIWLTDVQCKGRESNIGLCRRSFLEHQQTCQHSEDAGVICKPKLRKSSGDSAQTNDLQAWSNDPQAWSTRDPQDKSSDPQDKSSDPQAWSSDPQDKSSDPQAWSSDPQAWSSDPQDKSSDPQAWSSDPQAWSSDPQAWSSDPQDKSSDPQAWSSDPQAWSSDSQAWSSDPQAWSSDPQAWSSDPQDKSSDPQAWSSDPQDKSSDPQAWSSDPQAWSSDPQAWSRDPPPPKGSTDADLDDDILLKELEATTADASKNRANGAMENPLATKRVYLHKTRTYRLCEHKSGLLRCPRGQKISIGYANYGRTRGREICPHSSIHTVRCRSNYSSQLIRCACQGRNACRLYAKNEVYGDPCPGTFKYIEVKFKCI